MSNSVTPWTIARQTPLSMEFSRQEYRSGLPFSSPGDLPNPGIEPGSPSLQAESLPSEPQPHRSTVPLVREIWEFQLASTGGAFPLEPQEGSCAERTRNAEGGLSWLRWEWRCQCAEAQNPAKCSLWAWRGGQKQAGGRWEQRIRIPVRSPLGPGLSSTKSHRDGSWASFPLALGGPITSPGPDILPLPPHPPEEHPCNFSPPFYSIPAPDTFEVFNCIWHSKGKQLDLIK